MAYSEAFAKCVERGMVPQNYLQQGLQTAKTREKMFRHLFDQRKWPDEGWDDQTIEILLNEIASLDSNNFLVKGGVGEREGRVYSKLVSRRHFGMAHGIGRSGDLAEAQPKAAGSSLLSSLTNSLVLNLCRSFVCRMTTQAAVLPLATGMSISLCLQTMLRTKPDAKYVIWSRIDQKSCLKAILAASLIPVVVDCILVGEELQTNAKEIRDAIERIGSHKILCIITTTSCFAPRAVDNVADVACICKETSIFHLVNNAYGIQSTKCCNAIDQAQRTGRVDVFIQSTDKNLMVPVGGTIVAGFTDIVSSIQQNYPGRASSSQSLDVFITMLSMGVNGYKALLKKRKEYFEYLRQQMEVVALKYDEHILITPHNNISIGMSLKTLDRKLEPNKEGSTAIVASQLGSMLFIRNVQGARVVVPSETQQVDTILFKGWGSHCSSLYPVPYLTAAASIGMEKADVDFFIKKLDECMHMHRLLARE